MLLKCKICGGDLIPTTAQDIYECSYCHTQQTTPVEKNVQDDRIANLFNAANQFLKHAEFDRAERMFEEIIKLDNTEAEAHWGLIRCRYGIEYVYDKQRNMHIPTCHRTVWDPILTSPEYATIMQNTEGYKKSVYETEAAVIDKIQKDILSVVQQEEPSDVFICYKETDDKTGTQTEDSKIALALFHSLKKENLKVFYAPISLAGKLGLQYEPYIYSALSSAKVMLVIGTRPEYFQAPWVHNEWGRFMKIINQDRSKRLIPCYKNMNPYLDLPDEFKHIQGEDIGDNTITFVQKITSSVKSICAPEPAPLTQIVEKTVVKEVQQPTVITGNGGENTASLLRRMMLLIEDGDFKKADECCEKVLNIAPECAEAYLGKLMIEFNVRTASEFPTLLENFASSANFQKIMRFGDDEIKAKVNQYKTEWIYLKVLISIEDTRLRFGQLNLSSSTFESDVNEIENAYKNIYDSLALISGYKDVDELRNNCLSQMNEIQGVAWLNRAYYYLRVNEFEECISAFNYLKQIDPQRANSIERNIKGSIYDKAKEISDHKYAIEILTSILPWKDSDEIIRKRQLLLNEQISKAEKERLALRAKCEADYKKEQNAKVLFNSKTCIISLIAPLLYIMTAILTIVKITKVYNFTYDIIEYSEILPMLIFSIALYIMLLILASPKFTFICWFRFVPIVTMIVASILLNDSMYDVWTIWISVTLVAVIGEVIHYLYLTKKECKEPKNKLAFTIFFILNIILVCFANLYSWVIQPVQDMNEGDYRTYVRLYDIKELTIKDTVTSIDYPAFKGYSSLTSISIPDSVTSIGSEAFRGCSSLTSITIPDSVTSIGGFAFYDCKSLKNVHITDIAAWCNISFGDSYSNPLYYADNLYLNGNLITELIIPDGVTTINNYAFKGYSSLTSISIPDSVTSIGEDAFRGCSGIIEIENGVSYVDKWVIDCDTSADSVALRENTVGIADCTFMDCSSLTNITIPDSVTSIGENAFYNCSSLTSITIPDSVTSIGEDAFRGCSGIIEIENGVSYVDKWVIDCDTSADSVALRENTVGIADCTFMDCSSLTNITIPDSVTSIGENAFYNCSSLTSITIPDSVTSIGGSAFYGCSSLTSITIPDGVTGIGKGAFAGCDSLTSVTIPFVGNTMDGTNNTHFGYIFGADSYSYSYYYVPTSLKTVIITGGSSIGEDAFEDCSSLTIITIPDSVTSIGKDAFRGCSSLTSITIPDSVTSIGKYAFSGCSSLTSITIPDGVTSIGYDAFYGCSSLTSVTFEDPNGWWYTSSSTATSGTSIAASELSDPTTAAKYLMSTYYSYYWKKG